MVKKYLMHGKRIPQQLRQKDEIIAPQLSVRNEFVCWWCVYVCVCGNCHFIWWWRILAQSGREGAREGNNLDSDYQPALMQEEGNVSMATETTSQCVMWNRCWSLSRRRAHTVHLHAERPALHHVATRLALTAIPSHGGKISGLSQAQPGHHGLYPSQVWTHTEAQYGCHHVTPWMTYSNMQIRLRTLAWHR